jgi:predicted O-methyltransferase YrrM
MSNVPWIGCAAVAELDRLIGAGPRPFDIFEWGSGGSTIWFAMKQVGRVVTVEHNPAWHQQILEAAQLRGLTIEAHLRPAVPCPGCRHSAGHPASAPDMDFSAYVAIEGSYDLILVDGRARVMCFRNAVEHLRPGGYLVLHDSERQCYAECRQIAASSSLAVREIVEGRNTLICQFSSIEHGHTNETDGGAGEMPGPEWAAVWPQV